MIIWVVVWIVLSIIIASAGRNRKIGYGNALLICLILSPLIGAVVVLLSEKHSDTLTKLKFSHESGGLTDEEYKKEVGKIIPAKKDSKQRKEDIQDMRNGFIAVAAIVLLVILIKWIIKLF